MCGDLFASHSHSVRRNLPPITTSPRGLVFHLKAARGPLEEEGAYLLLEEEAEAEQALE